MKLIVLTGLLKKFYIIEILLLSLISLLVFFNNLNNEFVYDDSAFIKNNPYIRDFSHIHEYFTNLKTYQGTGIEGKVKIYRPIVTLSFAIDYSIWKLNPFGYHLSNNILHLICGFLVFIFFYQWSGFRIISVIASILFIIHPAQVEAVSWISGRGNMLYSIFALFSLIYFLKYLNCGKIKYLFITLIHYSISLLCKEMGMNILLLCSLIYLYVDEVKRKKLFSRFINVLLALSVISIIYLFIRYNVLSTTAQTYYWGGSPINTFFTMAKVVCLYLLLFFYPINLNVIPNVSVITSFLSYEFILSICFLALFFGFLIFNKKRIYTFGLWWGFLGLFPVLNIIPLQALIAERFLYLSNAGFCFFIALIINKINHKYKHFIILIIINLFMAISIARNNDWRDNLNLWKSSIKENYFSAKAHNGLALEYKNRGDLNASLSEFQTALIMDPKNIQIINNYAITLKLAGNEMLFKNILQDSLELKGNQSQTNHNLGLYYIEKREYEKALVYLEKSIEIDPDNANTYNSIGICYSYLKNEKKAIESWMRAYHLMPIWPEPYYNAIIYYLKNENLEKTEYYLNQALNKFPRTRRFVELKQYIKNSDRPRLKY